MAYDICTAVARIMEALSAHEFEGQIVHCIVAYHIFSAMR